MSISSQQVLDPSMMVFTTEKFARTSAVFAQSVSNRFEIEHKLFSLDGTAPVSRH